MAGLQMILSHLPAAVVFSISSRAVIIHSDPFPSQKCPLDNQFCDHFTFRALEDFTNLFFRASFLNCFLTKLLV